MANKPDFIDNLEGNTLHTALRQFLGLSGKKDEAQEDFRPIDEARIATAYFSPTGFSGIASAIAGIPTIRLLLGTDPLEDSERWQKQLGESENRFIARKLRESLKEQEDSLRAERDHIPFERPAIDAVKQLVASLRSGNMEVRRYDKQFLHAKAYIFSPADSGGYGAQEGIIAGSSNLTAAGLTSNLELNLGRYDTPTVDKARKWFDRLWDKASPFDLAAFFDMIFIPQQPFDIFLRVLWELYGNEVEEENRIDSDNLALTTFQKHGVVRALRLIEEAGGVIVADEVGLGKTFIAGDILQVYQERRQRALLICPAALRDSTWRHFIATHQLYLEVVSFEELALDEQLWDADKRPKSDSRNLARAIDEYQLVIIDEAHNYRNPDSPYRADALRTLLYGKRKDVLMLTATPVNNSLWDLYHLTRFFIKQDSFLAPKGIISIRERFDEAMKTNPNSLSPETLYPIVDATTVKRTRRFIKKHYPHDQIRGPDGEMQTIVFPEPIAITVRYALDSLMPGLFDLIETYFDPDPENPDAITFARYKAEVYRRNPDEDDMRIAHAVTGLLLSGLLKRFESSTGAFSKSINRLIGQHNAFLTALDEGYVISTQFFEDMASSYDDDFEEALKNSEFKNDAGEYNVEALRADVESDLAKLREIYALVETITPDQDPKLQELIKEIETILNEAKDEGVSREDEMDRRKIVIFSFFADTVQWINEYLEKVIEANPALADYRGRFATVVGSRDGDDMDRTKAAELFAPDTAGSATGENALDILISTDVLAEGVNLQQARHIINYDMPWNPMRLVQRHGRIDRISSKHRRVFLRTIFPVDRLDALLQLEEKITRKIAMAAASVGVVSPVAGGMSAHRDFTETKEEIQKLLEEDPGLYERGGTEASTQSGEEYRQTLRKALEHRREEIVNMPWKAGSGMRKGKEQGIFFCAKVGNRPYLRFVHADENWRVKSYQDESGASVPVIETEIGRCLRVIECPEDQELHMEDAIENAAYDLWLEARKNIYGFWMRETDPANLQPKVRPLNRKVAEFIRTNKPVDIDEARVNQALDILESPWPRRDEGKLREWFGEEKPKGEKVKDLVDKIRNSGLEPCGEIIPLPPIREEDIELLVWMGIQKT